MMLQGFASCVAMLSAVIGVSSTGWIFSPIGPRLCAVMCEQAVVCKHAFFQRLYLRCAFSKAGKDYDELLLPRKHIPCRPTCAKSEKCINTGQSTWLCARSEPRFGGMRLSGHPRSLSVKQFHSSAVIQKKIIAVSVSKPNLTNELSSAQCLVTVSRTSTHSTINVVVISTHVWYKLHKVQGRIHVIKSRDSYVFWCQQQPFRCGSFRFRLDGSKPSELQIKNGIKRLDIAVDVSDEKIFLVRQLTGYEVWTLQWNRKKIVNCGFGARLVDVSPTLRMVYLVKKDGKTVSMYKYSGDFVSEAVVTDPCYYLDVGSENQIYLAAKKKRLFVVTLEPGHTAHVHPLIFTSRMSHRVIAFKNAIYIYRKSKLYKLIDNKRLEQKPVFSIPQAWFDRHAPMASAFGVDGLVEDANCTTPTEDIDQLIVVAVDHYKKFGRKTTFFTLSVPGGEMVLLRDLSLEMFHFSTAGSYVFYTSNKHLAMFQYNGWTNGTEITLYTGQCYHVAVDIHRKKVFFVTRKGIVGLTFAKSQHTEWGGSIEGSRIEIMITLDTVNRDVYINTFSRKNIRRFSYSGQLQLTIQTRNTMRNIVIDLANNCFLAATKDERLRMDVIEIPHPNKRGSVMSKVIKTFSSGTIDYHILLDKYLVIQSEKSLTLLCRNSFKHLTRIDIGKHSGLQSVLGTLRRR